MNRRSFLAASLAAAVPSRAAAKRIDSSRVSAITDEVSRSQAESIEFAHKFGMQWLSLRDVPVPLGQKKSAYYSLEPDKLKQAMNDFKDAGIKISFLDTPFLKFDLPGTTPKRNRPEEPAAKEARLAREQKMFDNRMEDLRLGIRASHAFDCSMVRIFTFT
ncbi:MAG TPA: hypothetical protein VNU44_19480, partial [Bryobacteraceae bacterium]|nr:hypothetical protein [Bryobacteraceae bacterium]